MDIEPILRQLKAEREHLRGSIIALERLQSGKPKRGRPPKWMKHSEKQSGSKVASKGE